VRKIIACEFMTLDVVIQNEDDGDIKTGAAPQIEEND
jgi:hypothetical protein